MNHSDFSCMRVSEGWWGARFPLLYTGWVSLLGTDISLGCTAASPEVSPAAECNWRWPARRWTSCGLQL